MTGGNKAVAALLAAGAGVAAWAALTLREASQAVEQAAEQEAAAGRVSFERRAWAPAGAGLTMPPAKQDLRDAAWFAGSLWLAGKGGLGRYTSDGALERQWVVGADLPSAPLTTLAVGLDPRDSQPALFAGTAGEGLLVVGEDGRMELARAEEQTARDIQALLPLADGRLLIGTQQHGVLRYDASGMGPLNEALSSGHVVALAGAPEEIWIATLDEGLIRYHGGAIDRIDEHSGLPDKRLLSLAAEGDEVFAGTAVGIAELVDGKLSRTLADGFFSSALAASNSTLLVGTLEEADRRRSARPRTSRGAGMPCGTGSARCEAPSHAGSEPFAAP
ncbi:MAG: hypothetical protein R2748_26425 [Bryobacterales bacterium]